VSSRLRCLSGIVIYGPARDIQGNLHDARIGTEAVIYRERLLRIPLLDRQERFGPVRR
jgi:hypothetical protein